MRTHQGHLPEIGDDSHRPAERRAWLLHSMSPPGCPVPPGIAGRPLSTPGLPLPDVSDAGDGALVDNLGANKLRGAILAVLWLFRRQLLCIAEVADPDLFTARIRHQEVFWLQDSAGQRGAWQEAEAPPSEGVFPISRTRLPAAQQEHVCAGMGWEGAREPPTHFDVQVQNTVLVQVADPFQNLSHVGSDL